MSEETVEANDYSAAALLAAQHDKRANLAEGFGERAAKSSAAERVRRQRAIDKVKARQTEAFEAEVAEALRESNPNSTEE